MRQAESLMSFLFEDCCRGRVSPFDSPSADGYREDVPMDTHADDVLFICTGNSARSIFAEAILRDLGGGRFRAHSAGTRPNSMLNPFALQVLEANGHDTSGLRAKHVSEFQGESAAQFDFVFTVCDRAADEDCPAWQGQPITSHWGQPDPVKAEGTDAEKKLVFHEVYGALRRRIELFVALNPAALDRVSLQRAVDDLADTKDIA